ncbi:hypothetical protein D3C75_1216100 [compost metagenome]
MRALLQQPSALKHQNAVCRTDRAQPVGDHEAGPAFHQRLQPLLDLDLGHRIYAAGRFVQHQHGRTRKDRPRDGEQLLLPLADAAAVNRQHPLVAALHPHNK